MADEHRNRAGEPEAAAQRPRAAGRDVRAVEGVVELIRRLGRIERPTACRASVDDADRERG